MRKIASFLLVIILTVMCGMTAFAAPKTMPDGNKFDPQFYASKYPDVNNLANGDENLLYAHYLNIGKIIGYIPYESYVGDATAAVATPNTNVSTTQQQPTGHEAPAGYVFLTKSGKYYHSIDNCGKTDTNNVKIVTLEEAKKNYGPCVKCAN